VAEGEIEIVMVMAVIEVEVAAGVGAAVVSVIVIRRHQEAAVAEVDVETTDMVVMHEKSRRKSWSKIRKPLPGSREHGHCRHIIYRNQLVRRPRGRPSPGCRSRAVV